MRNTKIVATLGPASDPLIERLVAAGVDVFRLNFSHGSHEEQAGRVHRIRQAAQKLNRYVAILGDLQGPKIRIGKFRDGPVELSLGDPIAIDPDLARDAGSPLAVGTTYASLAQDLKAGDVIVFGDGTPEVRVSRIEQNKVICTTIAGGSLASHKGINLKGGGLSASALADKDIADLEFICTLPIDYVAVSFVRGPDDIAAARDFMEKFGGHCGLVAKLERAEAVACERNIDDIIRQADAVMVARGDLGIEIGDEALMGMQKHIIKRARALNRSVITATQMMESMVNSPQPTRAEVMDVANAVLDGTDAVMLSAETAVGRYPVETVGHMVRVIQGAELSNQERIEHSSPYDCRRIDESIAMAAMAVAERLEDVTAVIALTASGQTPRLMSRSLSRLPIYALANNPRTLARVALFRGVHPRLFRTIDIDYSLVNEQALDYLKREGALAPGNRVVLSKGDYRDVQGGTNTMKILEVT